MRLKKWALPKNLFNIPPPDGIQTVQRRKSNFQTQNSCIKQHDSEYWIEPKQEYSQSNVLNYFNITLEIVQVIFHVIRARKESGCYCSAIQKKKQKELKKQIKECRNKGRRNREKEIQGDKITWAGIIGKDYITIMKSC